MEALIWIAGIVLLAIFVLEIIAYANSEQAIKSMRDKQ
jgi:hypothetical protein